MSFPRYPDYKATGLEWLPVVPTGWEIRRLKQFCTVFPSNVDKKSIEGEAQVKLCNYTDVYYNDSISAEMEFMDATAPEEQVKKFALRAGDVIITKDSETADDIAIAAYVPKTLPGVICGYHLSMLRPRSDVNGLYVKRVFDSIYAKSLFAVRANGLTRVGLSQYAVDNVELPLPPSHEQLAIATFLDHETAKIDALIAEQQRLIELLQEKRQAVISHAVTKGLNPDAPMKDSGMEWLGEVPEHWEVSGLGHILKGIGDVDHYMPSTVAEGVPYLMTGDLQELTSQIDFNECKQVSHEEYEKLSRKIKTDNGDVIMARYATIGTVAYVDVEQDLLVSYSCVTIKPNIDRTCGMFLFFCLKSESFAQGMRHKINANTQENVGIGDLKKVKVAIPPLNEQQQITEHLQSAISEMSDVIQASKNTVRLLQERRSALISAAVTGQIDVRGLAEAKAGEQ
jgi:type I restriction enzyme, S subunit